MSKYIFYETRQHSEQITITQDNLPRFKLIFSFYSEQQSQTFFGQRAQIPQVFLSSYKLLMDMECTVKTDSVSNSKRKPISLLLTKDKNVSLKNALLHFAASVVVSGRGLEKLSFHLLEKLKVKHLK